MSVSIHQNALCESTDIGNGTRIWAFAHVLPGAKIGCDCNICDGVFIESDVIVGDRTTIKCGVQLWNGVRLGDDVFIGPNATFTNDIFPRSRQYPNQFLETIVESNASIGANATILPNVRIGRGSMVGAGAVVTRSVPPNAIVTGNPARIVGYVTGGNHGSEPGESTPTDASDADRIRATSICGVNLYRLPSFADIRGALSVGDFRHDLPFQPQRYFVVYDVPTQETRGEHAHRHCHQFLICLNGSVQVLADDGTHREEFTLASPSLGIHLPPMTWGTQYRYSSDAILLVFASESYDADEYIRSYAEFLQLVANGGSV